MYRKLEAMGYDVGRRMTERCALVAFLCKCENTVAELHRFRVHAGSLTRDKDRIVDTLDIIKFICRVFWKEVFQKQVDKLQTNHKVTARTLIFLFVPSHATFACALHRACTCYKT